MAFLRLVFYDFIYFTDIKNKMYQFVLFFMPLIFLMVIKYLTIAGEGTIQMQSFLIGVGLMSAWSYVLYSSGAALTSERWIGTLELLMNAKTSLFSIMMSKAINNAFVGTLSIVITWGYALFLFRFNVSFSFTFDVWISIIVLVFSLVSIGLVLAIFSSFFQNAFSFQNIILYPILLLSGTFYPIELLPKYLQYFAYLIPMSWTVDNLYHSVENGNIHIPLISTGLLVSLLYVTAAYFLLKRMSQKIKENSVMGVF